jgi:hypothetical protein
MRRLLRLAWLVVGMAAWLVLLSPGEASAEQCQSTPIRYAPRGGGRGCIRPTHQMTGIAAVGGAIGAGAGYGALRGMRAVRAPKPTRTPRGKPGGRKAPRRPDPDQPAKDKRKQVDDSTNISDLGNELAKGAKDIQKPQATTQRPEPQFDPKALSESDPNLALIIALVLMLKSGAAKVPGILNWIYRILGAPMTASRARNLFLDLVERGAVPLAGDAEPPPEPSLVAELVALTAIVFSQLVARRFATADDVRIEPFVSRTLSQAGPPPGVSAEGLARLIRATLGGDHGSAPPVAPEQVTALQLLLLRALVPEAGMGPAELRELLDGAEPIARQLVAQA